MPMPSFVSTTLKHVVPEDFEIPDSRPWEALKVLQNYPYFVTADNIGAAAILWTLQGGEAKIVTTLHPPLSPTAQFPNTDGFVVLPSHSVFTLFFHEPKGKKGPVDVAQTYSSETGELLHRLELEYEVVWSTPIVSGDFLILTAKEHDRRPKVVYYHVSATGLERIKDIETNLPDGRTAGMERLVPLHLEGDGSLLTASTSYPSNKVDLRFRDEEVTVNASHTSSDYINPELVVELEDSVALSIAEAEFDRELSPIQATVHLLSLPHLTDRWSRNIPHKITEMIHQPSLNALVLLGWKTTGVEGENDARRMVIITFLDVTDGSVLAERTFLSDSGEHALNMKCTVDDEFIVVSETGDIFISPLKSILDVGLPLTQDGNLATWHESPIRPEPYNAKATRAGSNWKWVKQVVFGPGVLVFFALRGPEFYVIRW